MSAGGFVTSKYQSNDGGIYKVKLQPETLLMLIDGVANSAPLGDVDQVVSAKVTKTRREIGMGCRAIAIRFTAAIPDGYKAGQIILVPVMTSALFNGLTGAEPVSYLNGDAEIVYLRPESRK